jgi:hypothetical protein
MVIRFPNPVFFVPGMNGVVNASYDDSDGKIRAFMNLQSGTTPAEIATLASQYALVDSDPETWDAVEWEQKLTEWAAIKRSDDPQRRIPAFVMFTIATFHNDQDGPNGSYRICLPGDNDKIDWGINACGAQFNDRISLSANHIQTHFNQNIKSEMQKLTSKAVEEVPFHVLAHSLGGVISRHWLVNIKKNYPLVEHYVTFDSPHGGVKLANSSLLRLLNEFWAEPIMNGFSDQNNVPPDPNRPGAHRGWNYTNRLPLDSTPTSAFKYLLFSAEDEDLALGLWPFIAPDGTTGTALGRGRIMKPASLFSLFDIFGAAKNGYCEKFVGGWGLQISDNPAAKNHSLQTEPVVFIPAARFIAHGNIPMLGTYDNPGNLVTPATDMSGPGGTCQDYGSIFEIPSQVKTILNAMAGSQQGRSLYFDENRTLTISAMLSDAGASVDVLDNVGAVIPRFNEIEKKLEGKGKEIKYDINVLAGTGTLRLTAGTADTAAIMIVDYNNDRYATGSAVNLHNLPASSVTLNTTLMGTGPAPLVGSGGTGQVTVIKPDGTEVVLVVFDDGLHGDGPAGDGIYGATLAGSETALEGRYSLVADMKIDMGGGVFVHRTGEGMFFVDYTAASLVGVTAETTVDEDISGFPDVIDVAMNINFTKNGSFSLNADLMSMGVKVDDLRNVFDVTAAPETKTVHLRIPAKHVHEAGASAVFTLASIDLYENTHALYIGSISDYTTQSYTAANFDLPPAPFIAGCIPSYGRPEGGDEVIIKGQEFDNVTAVYFNTSSVPSFQILNDSTLLVTTPPWDGGSEKAIIRVVTPWNEGTRSTIFEYYAANRRPVLNAIGNQLGSQGNLLTFAVSSSDPDGDPLSYLVTMADGSPISTIGASFIDNGNGTGTFNWTPATGQGVQAYGLKFLVQDAAGLADEEGITITVQGPGTLINDHVYSNTTWDLLHAPYIITQTIAVVDGATLTIEPGVEVRFDGSYGITVIGRLIAQGTAQQRITFRSNQVNPQWGVWEQLYIVNIGSVLNYLDVRDSKFGIYHNIVENNITNSYFENNLFASVFANGASPSVTNNTIADNAHGFLILGGLAAISQPIINNNQFSGQAGFNIYALSTVGDDMSSVVINAENNHWGTVVENEIQDKIYDGNDLGNEPAPRVDYDPYIQ